MPSKNMTDDNQKLDFDEKDETLEQLSGEKLFEGLKEEWRESAPSKTPLLSELNQNFENQQNYNSSEIKRVIVFPIHHLISIEKISPNFDKNSATHIKSQTTAEHRKRRQRFWELLAASGVEAKDAALLDNSLWSKFNDISEEKIIEIDWEVLYYDDLQGCGEIYRAEMFSLKRLVFEADSELRKVLELKDREFLQHYSSESFGGIKIEDYQELFLDNLIASFTLTVSGFKDVAGKYLTTSPLTSNTNSNTKKKVRSQNFDFYRTFSAKRIESWISEEVVQEENIFEDKADINASISFVKGNKENVSSIKENASQAKKTIKNHNFSTTYRLSLTSYWFEWQQAAKKAGFDFDLLNNLFDARAIRFYELTKLLRVIPQRLNGERSTNKSPNKASKNLPDRMEVSYEKFAALMPMPCLRSENEIKHQIKELIEPLKACGYVKSFALKSDWRGFYSAGKLIFTFRD